MVKRSISLLFVLVLCLYLSGQGMITPRQVAPAKASAAVNPAGLRVDFASVPLYFTANQGQVDARALFYARASSYTLWLTAEGLVFDSFKADGPSAPVSKGGLVLPDEENTARTYKRDVSRLVFLGAAEHPEVVPLDKTPSKANYYIGNDPAQWHTAIPTSAAVLYRNIYDHIDLKVYGVESRIEYDWIVKPGGDPGDIRFRYENVSGTRLDKDGNLIVETAFGELIHKRPSAYQPAAGLPSVVESAFKGLEANTFGFEVGGYDPGRELVIDPVVLAYSTFLGGSGEDIGYAIALDGSGKVYVTGQTSSINFPTLNQYQSDQPGIDVFVTKIDPTQSGTACLLYSTYLGGSSTEDGWDIAVDASGNVYVGGRSYSSNFPTLNQYQTYQGGGAGEEGIVFRLNSSGGLAYSSYLGGNAGDMIKGLAADDSGNAYVTGYTYASNFPVKNGYQTTNQGSADVFATKIDTTQSGTASLIYSTLLGGWNNDDSFDIALDGNGLVYVGAYTFGSSNFPTKNAYQSYRGSFDGLVIKLDMTQAGAASLLYSTYLGGGPGDVCVSIAADDAGHAYVGGITSSPDFPTLNAYQSSYMGGQDGFIAKLDTTQSGSACLEYSTFLGGSAYDYLRGLALDGSGRVYVTGSTISTDFPTKNAYQSFLQGSYDAFVAKIDPSLSGADGLVYSTYLGASGSDGGQNIPSGIALDGGGNAYVTGTTRSTGFPVLNQYQTYQGAGDAFITEIRTTADIAVTKSSDNLEPKQGEEVNFSITAANHGPFEATGLKVTDKLPTGLGFVSAAPSQGSYDSDTGLWTIGSLVKDASATLTLKAGADGSGEVANTASVSALNESDPDNTNDSDTETVTILIPCTITTSPAGLAIMVDSASSTAPQTFYWAPGESHAITVTSPQAGGTGTQFVYASWSDAGTQSHSIVAPSTPETYTASFTTQYTLTTSASPATGGAVIPSGTAWHDKDEVVQVQAASNAGYVFTGWSGNLGGYANPAPVTMDGPKTVTGNFLFGKNLNAPILLEPQNNTTGYPTSGTMKWVDTNSSPQELQYKVRAKIAGGVYAFTIVPAGTAEYLKTALDPGKTYYWNVMAMGDGTTVKNSPWANGGIDFKVTIAPTVILNSPVLTAPAQGAIDQPLSLTLQWSDTNDKPQESGHKVRFKKAGGVYSFVILPAGATTLPKSGLGRGLTYFWSVKALGNGTETKDSAWPADSAFQTIR